MSALSAKDITETTPIPMNFREIAYGSDEYGQECLLREQVLRAPLKLSLRDEDLGGENEQMHFGLFQPGGGLLACLLAVQIDATGAKLRQMAVSPDHQRTGLGRKLMEEVERNLHSRGFTRLTLHARATAAGFYQKLGWTTIGGEFEEVGIPHFKMEKTIGPGF
jgi:predicted GNAT family N-acyltransferase